MDKRKITTTTESSPSIGIPPTLSETATIKPGRLVSLDAFRGFIMILLALEGLNLARTAKNLGYGPDATVTTTAGKIWQALAFHTSHPEWISQFYGIGCSFWDLIMPAFLFMVGVAMPYSYAKRRQDGQSFGRLFAHAAIRAFVLIWLGVLIHSQSRLVFLFTNVLSVIGLGYLFVFVLLGTGRWGQLAGIVVILAGYWWLFASSPALGPDFDFAAVGSKPEWVLPGSFEHWTKNANAAAEFDRWFLNLFPRERPFRFRPDGYVVLGFVPAIATMLFGTLTGGLLRSERTPQEKLKWLLLSGIVCLALGGVAGQTVCPVIKRLWSGSFTVLTIGWVLLMFAAFFWIVDVRGYKRWTFPLVMVGMNPIVMYLMGTLMHHWTAKMLKVHFGQTIFDGPYGPMVEAVSVFCVFWLICWWLYRQKIFVRI